MQPAPETYNLFDNINLVSSEWR